MTKAKKIVVYTVAQNLQERCSEARDPMWPQFRHESDRIAYEAASEMALIQFGYDWSHREEILSLVRKWMVQTWGESVTAGLMPFYSVSCRSLAAVALMNYVLLGNAAHCVFPGAVPRDKVIAMCKGADELEAEGLTLVQLAQYCEEEVRRVLD